MQNIIDETQIQELIANNLMPDAVCVRDVLAKALECRGLDLREAAILMSVQDPILLEEIFAAAQQVKEEIYGRRVVIFAPLYISNLCGNECLYCAFRTTNRFLKRHTLDMTQIAAETTSLIKRGHKRILLVAGEAYPNNDFSYVLRAIETIYAVKDRFSEIRRINVNLAPLEVADFRLLQKARIGTYQLFQETYHRQTYKAVHVAGKKSDYDWRISVFDRALQAGINDVGLGVLFGLYDWRFEVLALLSHSVYLEKHFGVGPHTISMPRIEPALGSELAMQPPAAVSDEDFCKIIAILRLAVPYAGIILSTRESLVMRRHALKLGVSQISAGSCTNPGGYAQVNSDNASQFSLGDHRTLDEVVCDLAQLGYLPSFCTACYRLGRTGDDFMCLAKHGKIKYMCTPNALATFAEYLKYYATNATREQGEILIKHLFTQMARSEQQLVEKLLSRVKSGESDVFM